MVIICLAVIGTVIGIAGGTVGADVDGLKAEQGADMARALALAAAIARTPAGWDREDLTPVIVLVGKAGVAAQIHNDAGRLIRSSPGYAGFNSPVQQVPVIAEGQEVGSVTIKFEDKGLAEDISHYQTLRWHISDRCCSGCRADRRGRVADRVAQADRASRAARHRGARDGLW